MFGFPLEQIIFIVLSALAIITAMGLVILKDPVHSALSLVLTFFNVAGMYILMGAEFMAAIQVLVYSGAILVLFLFVIMLLQVRPGPSLNPLRFFQSKFAPVVGVALLAEILLVILTSNFFINGGKLTADNNTQAANMQKNVAYVVSGKIPLVDAKGGSLVTNTGNWYEPPAASGHTALFGKELYSRFILPFEISSIILLVAAIGAIVISRSALTRDPGEFRDKRGISLAGAPAPGSPQALEVEKERKLIMKK